jgi:hypothetical protein
VRDINQDVLYEAAHDAFMQFWHAADIDEADALWLAYCAAQKRLEQWLTAGGLGHEVEIEQLQARGERRSTNSTAGSQSGRW